MNTCACGSVFELHHHRQKFCTVLCRIRMWERQRTDKDARRAYQREYQRKRRASGKTKEYEKKRRRLHPRDEKHHAWLRAYYHSHKDEYDRRRREWISKPENRARYQVTQFMLRTRHLSDQEKEMRRVLFEMRRWCRANGYKGTKDFFEGGVRP